MRRIRALSNQSYVDSFAALPIDMTLHPA